MKKFMLSFCFAILLGAGLTSCSDDAAEITPKLDATPHLLMTDGDKPKTDGPTKP